MSKFAIGFILSVFISMCALPSYASGNPDPVRLTSSTKKAKPAWREHTTLYLNGVITGRSIYPLFSKLDELTRKPFTPTSIDLVINSPGGSVIAGMLFINRMNTLQARGTQFRCYVLDVAASMAFQILTQCDSRTALPTSFLLWHGVRTGADALTAKAASALAQDLKRMDELVLMQLENSLNLTASTIQFHFDRETLWSGLSLHKKDPAFIGLATFSDVVSGLDDAVQMAPMGFFDQLESESFIYMWEGYADTFHPSDTGVQ